MSDVLAEYADFLAGVLPGDYAERVDHYRHDDRLRTDFQVAQFEAGWLVPDWEPGLGGRSLAPGDALSVRIEGARRRVPRIHNVQGVGVVAPGLRRFGTPQQRDRLLRPVLRGDEWWALGMSEPGSGSDLASMRTQARREGADFVVTGAKIWTTQAHQSRWATLYARTDPDARRHAGISCLILDLHSPGVDIRPIPRAAESVDAFCEVFLDEVRIPAENLLGPLNEGWRVASESLEHERDMIWVGNWLEIEQAVDPLLRSGALDDEQLTGLGRLLADSEAIRFTGLRTVFERMAGREAPEFLVLKAFGSETAQRATRFAMEAAGPAGLTDPQLIEDRIESLGATIYGGTSEIQRDIIGERVLGLPRNR
ncbi:acyl-CoA dehydrogenase family protein [Actinomadura sp. 7K534]|uniref:acyl-CoA dehydrogenase family protein n=1 Tax=Actinomadura sp. 7K534 TaxID=2530366 RepID=UPI00104D3D4B|nr:acyl-CoA dehydrogenase family protein [Actinomadura sp. 7K534]TDB98196.1 acyl-CoA dehydrogenase [Actinomadura sp. 7K534]